MMIPKITFAILALTFLANAQEDDALTPISIAELERTEPVDFAKEIYPLFKANCIACHNSSKAKAKLNLESPKSILKGGNEGPAIVPGKADESFLLKVAAHQEDPIMPPEKNKANAVPFTSEELGLLKLWINEGAKGEAVIATATPESWILPNRNDYPVYHLAMGPEDRFVAASRGPRVFLYDIRQRIAMGELIDPALEGQELYKSQPPAHKDFVQSIAFSAEGWIATGGFRNAKLWKPVPDKSSLVRAMPEAITAIVVTPDGEWAAAGDAAGHVLVWKPNDAKFTPLQDKLHEGKVTGLTLTRDALWLGSSGVDGKAQLITVQSGEIAHTYTGGEALHSISLIPSAERLAAGTVSGKILHWSIKNREEPVAELAGHTKTVTALVNGPSQPNQMVSASEDGTVKLWDVVEAKLIRSMDHGQPLLDVSVSPNGEQVVSVAAGKAKVWNGKDGVHLRDLAITPEATSRQAFLKRHHQTSVTVVENRKKKVAELEKAWKDEVEKAKKAATDQIAAQAKRKESDLAAHKANLAHLDAKAPLEAVNGRVASLKQQVPELEANGKELGEQLLKEREGREERLESLRIKVESITAAHGAINESLHKEQRAVDLLKTVKSNAQTSLEALREVNDILGVETKTSEIIPQTENLLADTQQQLSVLEGDLFQAQQSKSALAAQLSSAQQQHDQTAGVLVELEEKQKATVKALETTKALLAKAEEESKKLGEVAKKAEEEHMKATDALTAANKAYAQALDNEELALRLSQRAAEAQTRAQTAFTVAETQLKTRKEALDAAAKMDPPSLTSVTFTPDGTQFAVGRADSGSLIFSADGERLLRTLPDSASTVVASLNGDAWLVGAANKEICQWKGQARWAWKHTIGKIDDATQLIDRVTALSFSPNGSLLATGSGSPSRSGQLKIWRVADGSLLTEIEDAHSDTIVGLEFSPDGEYLATASTDRFAKVFRVRDGSLVSAFEGHTAHVLDVSWRADGLMLATSGADNVIKLWDFEEKRQIKTINGYNNEITSVAFTDDGETLLTSSGDKTVRLGEDRLDGKEFVYASALSQDGEWVVAASQDSVVRVWQAKDKKLVQEFGAPTK